MPIPTYQQCMLPILQLMADEKIRRRPKITAAMADHFRLTDEERAESLKAGTKVIESRSGWAITYLNKADLIDNATRGNYQITTAGKDLLDTGITKLHNKELLEVSTSFKEWCDYCDQKWRDRKEEISDPNGKRPVSEVANEYSPEETLQNAWSELKIAVIGNIHSKLKECDPALFEKITTTKGENHFLAMSSDRLNFGGSPRMDKFYNCFKDNNDFYEIKKIKTNSFTRPNTSNHQGSKDYNVRFLYVNVSI